MIKDENIHLRVNKTIKSEMIAEANKYGLSITNYLIFLHCEKKLRGDKIA
jgi:antitoxin component of RelBE/YafQ-DinJ toxin-antitoxin module